MNGKLTFSHWVWALLLQFVHGVWWWPGRTLATPEVAASGVSPGIRSKPLPPVPLCQCQSTSHEQAKNHRLDISTGSQKGSFMGHYSAEQQAVCEAITTGAQVLGGLFDSSCWVSPGIMWQQNVQLDGGGPGRKSVASCVTHHNETHSFYRS